ncbi:MAG: aldose 1-epimerase family protein [Bacteroidota bacterium]
MKYAIQSSKLKVEVLEKGAELCSIQTIDTKTEYLWQADPQVWGSHAPVLFPIIGALKENRFWYDENWYTMPKHGIIRHNEELTVEAQSEDSIQFLLSSGDALSANYPFEYEFRIRYRVQGSQLEVSHEVANTGSKPMYFSIGGHPGFRCPLFKDESYEDYFIEFEHPEHADTWLLDMESGLVSDRTERVLDNSNQLPLHKNLFNRDALIFKTLQSRSVNLCHKKKGAVLSVHFNDFPYLGIWAKPNADFVCIEPWLGIADSITHNQKLTDKEGILKLDPDTPFSASFSIQVY